VVGEWSLATPNNCQNQAYFASQQIGAYETYGSGWFMWAHNNAQGWREWSFKAAYDAGWIKPKGMKTPNC